MLHSSEQNGINPLLSLICNLHDCHVCSFGCRSFHPYSNYPPSYLHSYFHGHGKHPHRIINCHGKQTPLMHRSLSTHPYLPLWGAACTAVQSVESQSSKPPSPPSFTGGGENFKGWQRKLKGTLFIRALAWNLPWVCQLSEPATAPWYAESRRDRATTDRRKGREGQRRRQKQRENDIVKLEERRDWERQHTNKTWQWHIYASHNLILPLMYF